MRKFLTIKTGIITFAVLLIAFLGVSGYFFKVAHFRGDLPVAQVSDLALDNPVYSYRKSFFEIKKDIWELTSDDGLNLKAWYLPAEKPTNKTVIVVHGHNRSKERMAEYGWLFHQWGYNVLLPDNRAHGESEGKLIGYGWTDRLEQMKWIDRLITEHGDQAEISLYGLSMGGATVMMLSGEELPSNVIAFMQDCGYDTVWNQIGYRAKVEYGLPPFPILNQVSIFSKIFAGYGYQEASSVKQLEKNERPFLFIHGDADTYVPVEVVYRNYAASNGEKELVIFPGAEHGECIEENLELYESTLKGFLDKHMPL